MEEIYKKFEKLEEIEQDEKAKMDEYLYDAELDLAYETLENLAEKIAQKEGISIEEARYKAEKFIEEVVKEEEDFEFENE